MTTLTEYTRQLREGCPHKGNGSTSMCSTCRDDLAIVLEQFINRVKLRAQLQAEINALGSVIVTDL